MQMVGALGILLAGWFVWNVFHPKDSGIGATITGVVKRGDLVETVTATGSIAAQTGAMVKIGSQITGRIKRLYADVGTQVKAGDLIAELDLPDITAQLAQAKASHASSEAKLVQQKENVVLGDSQTQGAIAQARANLASAQQRLASAVAASNQQTVQTPADIDKAAATLKTSTAALSTAESQQVQVKAGADLQIQNTQEAVSQAQAVDTNNQANLKRQQSLFDLGYVSQSVVDQARQEATVSHSQVTAAQQTLELTKQKVTADLQAAADQVAQAKSGVVSAQAALKSAQGGTYTVAARKADVDDAKAAVAAAEASLQVAVGNLTSNAVHAQDVAQASAAVDQAAAQVAVNQAQVDKTLIRTPISGTVLQLATQQGETLAAGLSAPTLIIVADLTRLEVDAFVDETDIGKVKVGQPVTISVDAFPDDTMTGKVAKVASGSTIQQGVVTYSVTVFFDDTKHQLKPDMTASVTIQTGKRTGVLMVPSVAVQVGNSGSTVKVVSMQGGKKVIQSVPVKTGGTDGINVEILDGLTEGQTIVLAGGDSTSRRQSTASPLSPGAGRGGGGGPGGGGPPRG